MSTYATDEIITPSIKEFKSHEQVPGISSAVYAKRLHTKALRSGIVYEEKHVKSLLIEGIDDSICYNMRVRLGRYPRAPLIELTRKVDTLMKITYIAQG